MSSETKTDKSRGADRKEIHCVLIGGRKAAAIYIAICSERDFPRADTRAPGKGISMIISLCLVQRQLAHIAEACSRW